MTTLILPLMPETGGVKLDCQSLREATLTKFWSTSARIALVSTAPATKGALHSWKPLSGAMHQLRSTSSPTAQTKDVQDRNGMTAFDLTTPIARNRKERKRLLILSQEPADADNRRRIIGVIMNPQGALTSVMNSLAVTYPPQTDSRYIKSTRIAGHAVNVAYYEHKTDYSVSTAPIIIAMSGFKRRNPLAPFSTASCGPRRWNCFAICGENAFHVMTEKTMDIPEASILAMRKSS